MAYRDAVLADSPIVFYEFNETTGTTIADSSGNARDASQVGLTLAQTGATLNGKAVAFHGFDDQSNITLPASIVVPAHSAVTIEFWFKIVSSDVGGTTLFNIGGSSSTRLSAHVPWSDNTLYFDFGGTSGNSRVSTSIASKIDGAWHHCALVNGSGSRRIHIDGVQVVAPAGSYDLLAALSGGKIGHPAEITDTWWKGSLDEFAVYTTALSSERILAHYNARNDTGAVVLSPDSLSVAVSMTASAITQGHAIAPSALSVATALSAPGVTQVHVMAPLGLGLSPVMGTATISQNHVLTPAALLTAPSIEASGITQDHRVTPSGLSVQPSLGTSSIVQVHAFAPADMSLTVLLSEASITPGDVYTIAPDDLSLAPSLAAAGFTQVHTLAPDALALASVLQSAGFSQVHVLSPTALSVATALGTTTIRIPNGELPPGARVVVVEAENRVLLVSAEVRTIVA